MSGVAPAFLPPSATNLDSPFAIMPLSQRLFEEMLESMGRYVDPPVRAVKSGELPPLGSFPNRLAKLCLFSYSAEPPEKRDILSFVNSMALHTIASYTLSAPLQLEAAERLVLMKEFNELVDECLQGFRTWCCYWDAVPRCDIPSEEAAKQLSWEAFSAPNDTNVPWTFLVLAFGSIPELWGLEPSDSSDPSRAESSGASVGWKGKTPETPYAAPLARLEESPAVADVDPMAVDSDALGSPPSLPDPMDSYPARGISLRDPGFEATTRSMHSGEGAIANGTSAHRTARISEVQTADINQSTLPTSMTTLLQLEDITTFLSAFGILTFLPGSELATILHSSLESKEKFKLTDCEELKQATAKVLGLLHEFKRVHGEFVKKLWKVVRHARQWHTWGLEVQYFYQRYGVVLSPDALSAQRKLFTFTNGFTVLVLQLMSQQAGFELPEA